LGSDAVDDDELVDAGLLVAVLPALLLAFTAFWFPLEPPPHAVTTTANVSANASLSGRVLMSR